MGFSRVVAAAIDGPQHIHIAPVSKPTTTQAFDFGPAIATHPASAEWGHHLDGHQF